MANQKKQQAARERMKPMDWALLLPILFFTTIFLFFVRARIASSYVSGFFWSDSGEYVGDLYAYCKMQVFIGITVIFGIYLLYCLFVGKVKLYRHKVYIPMLAYALLALLSYVFSEYKEIALVGYLERYEGTAVLVCYMVILFYAMHAIRSERAVRVVIRCFSVACLLLGIWGICQVCGIRISSLPSWLYVPASMRNVASLSVKQATTAVTWFFSNQNYTSFFMVFPICIFAMTCIAQDDMKKKIAYAALTGLMLFCLWRADSLGGMVGLAMAVLAALLIAGIDNIRKWWKSLVMLVLAGVISIGASLPSIMGQLRQGGFAMELLGLEVAYAWELDDSPLRFAPIDYVITDGSDIIFGFAEEQFRISTEDGALTNVTDSTGATLSAENDLIQIGEYIDAETGYPLVAVRTANNLWYFVLVEGEAFFVTPKGVPIRLDKVESIGFENNQDFATNRGYIWSRTLPLLKETLLLGKGADTFAIYFPQDDYAGRYNIKYLTEQTNIIIDKPHNMYLGTAVNTGVLSLVALLVIYALYLFESIRLYRKHSFRGFADYIGMGICIAVIGFLVSGIVNDSTVQMMPIVYTFLGMGFAINRMQKENAAEE